REVSNARKKASLQAKNYARKTREVSNARKKAKLQAKNYARNKRRAKKGSNMENYNEKLKIQLKEIEDLIAISNKNLEKLHNAPNRRVRIGKSNGNYQYSWVDEKTKKRIYIPKAQTEDLRKTVQRDYEIKVNKKLNALKRRISDFLRIYDIDEVEKVYTNLSPARKRLVIPIVETKEEFIKRWKSVKYEPMAIDENIEFVTANGIKVRSKSELIIANMLEQKEIPYRYEYPLFLKGVGTVRPDFMCLNIRTGKEYVWEHFGMMDNIAYAGRNISKIQTYEQNGYLAGKNMIMTFETSANALNTSSLRCVIEEYLL
ncbi:MAG: hypothetical protein J5625_00375, partial [Lachnospiraceae bacterium]|nr:hypothetical protein [Lachnospiraceae bacterium]